MLLMMILMNGERNTQKMWGKNLWLNWNPSFQFASLSSDLANRLQK